MNILQSLSNSLESMAHSFSGSPLLLVGVAFCAGILTSLLPCSYPLLGITTSILGIQASASRMHNFITALLYALGTAIMYGLLGGLVIAAKKIFGISLIFGQWFTNKWFIASLICILVYFALALFDCYELYIPRFLQRTTSAGNTKTPWQLFFAGMLAGTTASPCMGPILGALLLIALQLESIIWGFFFFFSFGLGLGVLLVIIGMSIGLLQRMPRAGTWMNVIKHIMGALLLGVAAYFFTLNEYWYAALAADAGMTPDVFATHACYTLWTMIGAGVLIYIVQAMATSAKSQSSSYR